MSLRKSMKRMFGEQIDYCEESARIHQSFTRTSIVIHHYCPHTFNAGDHFVVLSIRKHLSRLLQEAVYIPKAIAVNRGWGGPHRLRGKNISFSNRYADAVVVGGSDNYRNWSLRIDGKEIRKLQPPLFLVGLGVSSNDLNEKPLIEQEKYLTDIRITNEKALVSTVRDDATLRFLQELGVSKAVCTGCPALFIDDTQEITVREGGDIIVTFPFPVNRQSLPKRYAILHGLIPKLVKRYGSERLLISCHDDRDVGPASELFPGQRFFFSNYPEQYLDIYRRASMVIGSRLHGTMLSASVGTPFLNIDVDIRGQAFTETFGMKGWNLEYTSSDLADSVIQRIDSVFSGDLSSFEAFRRKKNELKTVFESTMDEIAGHIRDRLP